MIFASEDLPLSPKSFHHRSFLRSINISVKESQCYQVFTKVPQLATQLLQSTFADGYSTCTTSFNKFKSFAGAAVGRRQRTQDFMYTTTPKTQKSTRPCVSLFVRALESSISEQDNFQSKYMYQS